jgi:hypothetical protein
MMSIIEAVVVNMSGKKLKACMMLPRGNPVAQISIELGVTVLAPRLHFSVTGPKTPVPLA